MSLEIVDFQADSNAVQWQQLVQLIYQQTGIEIKDTQVATLRRKLYARLKTKRVTFSKYLRILQAGVDSSAATSRSHASIQRSQLEWEQLMPLITTGESFFFRDQGQFHLLRTQLLPELIEKQRTRQVVEQCPKPSLRIWSAGCSSGEEAYSLAILLTELLPDWQDWNLQVIGTDINPLAIAKAKSGLYTPWSFRQVDDAIVHRYFQKHQDQWQIRDYLQHLTHFQVSNLFADPYPNRKQGLINLDLILCRNVFIYCDRASVETIVEKFNATLRPGGYLLTAHTELRGFLLPNWKICSFPESLVYQQMRSNSEAIANPVNSAPAESQVTPDTTSGWVSPPASVIPTAATVVSSVSPPMTQTKLVQQTLQDYQTAIQSQLRAEQFQEALALANTALVDHPENRDLLYQIAAIATAQNNIQLAKTTLRKVLYLYPSEGRAYLELAQIYDRLGDTPRSQKMREVANSLAH